MINYIKKEIRAIARKFLPRKIRTALYILRYEGIQGLISKMKQKNLEYRENRYKLRLQAKSEKAWNSRHGFVISPDAFSIARKVYRQQKDTVFPLCIKFSILVPIYNVPKDFLREMIASVLIQTYSDWELCLADGSDSNHLYIQEICEKIATKDRRIKYKKLEKNGGISENTNACLKMATGDYISLIDHDDLLHPSVLFEMMKKICEENADFIYTDEAVFESPNLHQIGFKNFKPDFAPDYLNGNNYITHFISFSSKLQKLVGNFDSECDGAQDYDMILKITEHAEHISHIPKCLYYWRASPVSTASSANAKSYTINAGRRALEKHFERSGIKASVFNAKLPNTYRIKYQIKGMPFISILIPSSDHVLVLKKCLDSIQNLSTYKNYEIIIIENNSKDQETFDFYDALKANEKIKIVSWIGKFNYSAINNFGVKFAKGDYLLLLNNDTEVISSNWLEEMLMYAQRNDVGGVGAMLYYPNDKIQHAGVIIGLGGYAAHSHRLCNRNDDGYAGRLGIVQNYSAVTAACIMIPKKVYEEINGFDEDFEVAYNDVDLCLRIRKAGYLIVWTPFAELYHYESESRGADVGLEKQKRFDMEKARLYSRWHTELEAGDPYYNPNLTLAKEDFSVTGEVFPKF